MFLSKILVPLLFSNNVESNTVNMVIVVNNNDDLRTSSDVHFFGLEMYDLFGMRAAGIKYMSRGNKSMGASFQSLL